MTRAFLRRRLAALLAGAAAAALACLLASCASAPVNLLQQAVFAPPDSEAAWSRYHWYAAELHFGFTTREYLDNGYRGMRTYTEFRLVAKVLTPEGSQVGTIPLPGWNRSVAHMEVELYDSTGRKIPFDRHALDSTFREKSVLVVPKVTHGCVLAVLIKQGPYGPYGYFEYPVALSAPINRFTLKTSYPNQLRYVFHESNGLPKPLDSLRRGIRTFTWSMDHILPVPDLPFLDGTDARPALLMVSRYNGEGDNYSDWKNVAKYTAKEKFRHSLLNMSGKPAKRGRELAAGKNGTEAARAILEWAQDNITLQDEGRANLDPDEVFESQRGNRWQMAALLSAMYSGAGLENEIVLSRPREYGGLDPAVPNPMAVWEPLVLVRADGKEWAACPHLRWFGLGGYPAGLAGMQAMSLKSGIVRPLPDPAPARFAIETHEELSVATLGKRSFEAVLEGAAAAQAREILLTDGVTAATCGRFLAAVGFDAAPESCAEEDLDRRDRPLRLKVTAKGGYLTVASGRNPRVKLESAFSRAAWFYDSARVEAYFFPYEQRRKETMILRGAGGETELACAERKNPVFEVSCRKAPVAGGMQVTREVVIHPGRFPAAALAALNAELAPLESSVPAVLPRP